jgi:two-component system CheB/CheR fusion protein
MNLIPADVGRRVTDVRPNVELPDLGGLVREVIDTVSPRDVEVRDGQGRWYSMRVRPYKTREQRIDGVVITWVDIDARQGSRRTARAVAEALLSAHEGPAALLSAELRVEASNEAWRSLLPDGAEDDAASWAEPALVASLRVLAAGGAPVVDRPTQIRVGLDARPVAVSARAVRAGVGDTSLFVTLRERS